MTEPLSRLLVTNALSDRDHNFGQRVNYLQSAGNCFPDTPGLRCCSLKLDVPHLRISARRRFAIHLRCRSHYWNRYGTHLTEPISNSGTG